MTTTTEHIVVEAHKRTHGPSYGHEAVIHFDHANCIHDSYMHRKHDGHYDECTICTYGNCSNTYTTCICEDCACPTCSYNARSCGSCDCFSCSSRICEDRIYPTCRRTA